MLTLALMTAAGSALGQGVGYWHTSGAEILDSDGERVRIAGINWYGFETTDQVVHGLYAQDYHTILETIHAEGYNTIRLPFSNQMVEHPIVPTAISTANAAGPINTDLAGLNSLQIMDKIVTEAGALGLKVILDNHRSEAGNSNEASGLWYTAAYPETKWIADWETLATRYKSFADAKGNPTVIGVDLRNEPHLLTSTAARTGSCWTGDTWSNGCPVTDTAQNWPAAAERAAKAILGVNPGLLILVEGTDCYSGDCGWQGANLEGAAQHPVTLTAAGKLVYSAHDYGPDLDAQSWFSAKTTAASLDAVWTKYWGYLSIDGTAPVWIGEFGTTNAAGDIESNVAGSQGQWFSSLVAYLGNQPNVQWTYWALNGEDEFALLDNSYDATPVSSLKQQLLSSVEFPLHATDGPTPVCKAVPAAPAGLTAVVNATGEVQLGWKAVTPPANCQVSYSVYRGTASGFKPSGALASGLTTVAYADDSVSAGSTYYYVVEAVDAYGSSAASAQVSAKTPPAKVSSAACHVTYAITGTWSGGFQASLAIENTGTTNLSSWTLAWTFPGSQKVTAFWNGVETQSGEKVTVASESYNASLPAGATATGMGFTASYTGTNLAPTGFTLNGVACK
jgi:endoglucanase